jgi:hypothetical protein
MQWLPLLCCLQQMSVIPVVLVVVVVTAQAVSHNCSTQVPYHASLVSTTSKGPTPWG